MYFEELGPRHQNGIHTRKKARQTHLCRGMNAKNTPVTRIASRVFQRIVMAGNELVVVLTPSKDVTPMTQIIGYYRQSSPPSFYRGIHIIERIGGTLVELSCFLQLYDLVGGNQCKFELITVIISL